MLTKEIIRNQAKQDYKELIQKLKEKPFRKTKIIKKTNVIFGDLYDFMYLIENNKPKSLAVTEGSYIWGEILSDFIIDNIFKDIKFNPFSDDYNLFKDREVNSIQIVDALNNIIDNIAKGEFGHEFIKWDEMKIESILEVNQIYPSFEKSIKVVINGIAPNSYDILTFIEDKFLERSHMKINVIGVVY